MPKDFYFIIIFVLRFELNIWSFKKSHTLMPSNYATLSDDIFAYLRVNLYVYYVNATFYVHIGWRYAPKCADLVKYA